MGIPGLIGQALASGNYAVPQGMRKIKGEVRINGKPAREGQLVLPGDKVSTGPGGEAIYVIDKNAFLQRSTPICAPRRAPADSTVSQERSNTRM